MDRWSELTCARCQRSYFYCFDCSNARVTAYDEEKRAWPRICDPCWRKERYQHASPPRATLRFRGSNEAGEGNAGSPPSKNASASSLLSLSSEQLA